MRSKKWKIQEKEWQESCKNPHASLLTHFPSLSPFSLLYSLAPNPRSPISSENLPRKALYFHWRLRTGGCQTRRSEGPGTRVEGKHGGRWHLGRELSLTPLKSASSYPHIQTCIKSPASRNLEASWKDMTCWRQEESRWAAGCYEQALQRGSTDSLGGPTAAPVPPPSACQASGYSGKHHDLAWVSLLQEAAQYPQLDQSPIPARTASGPASAAAPITAL